MADPVKSIARAELVVEAARQDIARAMDTNNTTEIAHHLKAADQRLASVRYFLLRYPRRTP